MDEVNGIAYYTFKPEDDFHQTLQDLKIPGVIGFICGDIINGNMLSIKRAKQTFGVKFVSYSTINYRCPLFGLCAYYDGTNIIAYDKRGNHSVLDSGGYEYILKILKKWNTNNSFKDFIFWFNNELKAREVPELDNVREPPVFACLRRQLFRYQYVDTVLMYNMERTGIDLEITAAFSDVLGNVVTTKLTPDDIPLEYKTKVHGGIFANEIGTGKTAAILAHSVLHNVITIENIKSAAVKNQNSVALNPNSGKIMSKATIIFTENHLITQLEEEIADTMDTDNFNITTKIIRGKKDWMKLCANDMIFSTFIITTYSFIHGEAYEKNRSRIDIADVSGADTILPLDYYHFNRIIVDEFQKEIKSKPMYFHNNYRGTVFDKITANYKWIMSGTPFSDIQSVNECMHFLINDKKYFNRIIFNNKKSFEDIVATIKKCTLGTKKRDITCEVKFPRVNMNIVKIPMSKNERTLYNAMSQNSKYSKDLHKFCICSNIAKMESGTHVFCTIDEVERKIISNASEEIEKSKTAIINFSAKANDIELILGSLNVIEAADYYKMVQTYKNKIEEEHKKLKSLTSFIRYIENEFKNISEGTGENSTVCDICSEDYDDNEHRRAMTQCAHSMCQKCIHNIIERKMKCPECNGEILEKTVYYIADNANFNDDASRMGSKISRLVHFLIDKTNNTDGNVLLFCTWDSIIPTIIAELEKNKIKSLYLSGNTMTKAKILRTFNDPSNEYRLMMLSTNSSAEGTNLTRADVIIFVDTVTECNHSGGPQEDSREFRRNKMKQAIGRSHRIGQENDVEVYMFLMEDTVETDEIKNEMFTFVNEM